MGKSYGLPPVAPPVAPGMLGMPVERGALGSVESCRASAAIAGRCDAVGRFERMAMERHTPHKLEFGGIVRCTGMLLEPIANPRQ